MHIIIKRKNIFMTLFFALSFILLNKNSFAQIKTNILDNTILFFDLRKQAGIMFLLTFIVPTKVIFLLHNFSAKARLVKKLSTVKLRFDS